MEEDLDFYNQAQDFLDWINYLFISKNRKTVDVSILEYGKYTYSFVLVNSENMPIYSTESFHIRDFCKKLIAFYGGLAFAFMGE